MLHKLHAAASGRSAIVMACVLWPSAYCIRKTYLAQTSPFMLLFLTCAAISLFVLVVMPKFAGQALATLRIHRTGCIGISLAGVVGGSTLFYFALDRLSVGVAGVLEKLQPVFVILLAWLFLGERFPLRKLPWVAAALLSSYAVSQGSVRLSAFDAISFEGMVYALLAALCYSASGIIGRKLLTNGANSSHLAFLRFLIALPVFLVILWSTDELRLLPGFSWDLYLFVSAAAVVFTGGGYVLFYRGLRDVPAGTASLIELSSSIFAVAIGMVFLGERLRLHQLAGALMLLYCIHSATRRVEAD